MLSRAGDARRQGQEAGAGGRRQEAAGLRIKNGNRSGLPHSLRYAYETVKNCKLEGGKAGFWVGRKLLSVCRRPRFKIDCHSSLN